ncbi:MAG: 3'-5' exonuclease, partial [Anaerolineaceae bacterium]
MPTLVSIDVETTGLDPQNDALIEIAAVKFNERRIEDEFSTLINPGRVIPREITLLTGITNEMVRNAPVIFDVIDEFAGFVGDAPVVGHSVHFDLGFLKKQRVLQLNESICTYELASVLLPTASRYNLEALAQLMNIYNPESHRALSDARTTQALFKELFEKCMQLPYEVVEEIGRLSD